MKNNISGTLCFKRRLFYIIFAASPTLGIQFYFIIREFSRNASYNMIIT